MKRAQFTPFATRKRLIVTGLALVILVASAASARAWLAPGAVDASTDPPAPSEPRADSAAQEDPRGQRIESEVVTILPTGFSPSEITRPRGRFLIVVDNRSGLEETNLRLERAAGSRLREVRRTKEELIWRQLEDLPPGEYVLTEASHPEWACRITITPH